MNPDWFTGSEALPFFRCELTGDNKPGRVLLEWPASQGGSQMDLQVTLEQENLSASGPAWMVDPPKYASFFESLTCEEGLWDGEKSLTDGSVNFTISSDCFRYFAAGTTQQEVNLCFTLASDSQDPFWSVTVRLVVSVERMPALIDGVVSFFQSVQAEIERMAPQARREERAAYLKSWFRHVQSQGGQASLTLSTMGSSLTDMADRPLTPFVLLPVGGQFQQKYGKWGMIWTIKALDDDGVILEFEDTGEPPSSQTLSASLPRRDQVRLPWA